MGDQIVFFDVETTTPARAGRKFWLLEFGAILVCSRRLVEVDSYCTLIRPGDLSMVSPKRFSGITREAVAAAPVFEEVASRIFEILNGRYMIFFLEDPLTRGRELYMTDRFWLVLEFGRESVGWT